MSTNFAYFSQQMSGQQSNLMGSKSSASLNRKTLGNKHIELQKALKNQYISKAVEKRQNQATSNEQV